MNKKGYHRTSEDAAPEGSGDFREPGPPPGLPTEEDLLQEIAGAIKAEEDANPGAGPPVLGATELVAGAQSGGSDDSSFRPAAGPVRDSAAHPPDDETAAAILNEIADALGEEYE